MTRAAASGSSRVLTRLRTMPAATARHLAPSASKHRGTACHDFNARLLFAADMEVLERYASSSHCKRCVLQSTILLAIQYRQPDPLPRSVLATYPAFSDADRAGTEQASQHRSQTSMLWSRRVAEHQRTNVIELERRYGMPRTSGEQGGSRSKRPPPIPAAARAPPRRLGKSLTGDI
jgi:hypothetical protein